MRKTHSCVGIMRTEARGDRQVQVSNGTETFQGLGIFKRQTYLRDGTRRQHAEWWNNGKGIGNVKMARGRKFGVWQPGKKRGGGGGGPPGGRATPGLGEGRTKVHLQSQPCLSERADKRKGEEKMEEKVVIQGLANPESRTCDGNLSRTPDPV
jgi:hypothetical protein